MIKGILGYIRSKKLELILAVILAVLLYIWQFDLSFTFSIFAATGVFLFGYDLTVIQKTIGHIFVILKQSKLEIVLSFILLGLLVIYNVSKFYLLIIILFYTALLFFLKRNRFSEEAYNGLKNIWKQKIQTILLAILIILMMIWHVPLQLVAIVVFGLMFIFYNWNNRIIGICAIASLTMTFGFLLIGQNDVSEQWAIYTYYFLVILVFLKLTESRPVQKTLT